MMKFFKKLLTAVFCHTHMMHENSQHVNLLAKFLQNPWMNGLAVRMLSCSDRSQWSVVSAVFHLKNLFRHLGGPFSAKNFNAIMVQPC